MNIEHVSDKINENITSTLNGKKGLLSSLCDDAMLDRGKRLRAKMFFAVSKETTLESLDIATAIELLHSATLIHDDIVDNSLLRRGGPALYAKHGIANSLLYGDYLVTSAFSLIARLDGREILTCTTAALKQVLEGEIAQNTRCRDITLTKPEYLSIVEKKSGVFFGLACALGAKTRRLDEKTASAYYKFGINIGMAYQVMDDLLDYFGKDKDKQLYNDLTRGIITLPVIYLFDICSGKEKQEIISVLNDTNLKDSSITKIISLMKNYSIPSLVSKDVKALIRNAETLLPACMLDDFNSSFDILSWIEGQVEEVQEEYCNSRRGL